MAGTTEKPLLVLDLVLENVTRNFRFLYLTPEYYSFNEIQCFLNDLALDFDVREASEVGS